jgi:aspartyl-tRNA(Asn)/glutamyl-tRNA(Gln) amidotransferase subunit A
MSPRLPTAMTLRESSAALLDGTVTARDLLSSAVRRMGATRHLNAFVGGVLPDAQSSADASDARYRAGAPLSTLDGAPIAVKDNFCLPGAPTTAGSRALRGFSSPVASTVTSRLAAAGAVLFAKTNMDEFGMGSANLHSAHGPCVSPWMARPARDLHRDVPPDGRPDPSGCHLDPSGPRVAGGSSGGSAAAVASGAAIVAVGSDTGGSVRLPAAYCGLVGLKPTYGRLSRWGLVPYCSSLDVPGFLTRTVPGAVAALRAAQGLDPLDPTTVPADPALERLARRLGVARGAPLGVHIPDDDATHHASAFLRSKPAHAMLGWRVGVPAEYDVAELSEEVRAGWRAAVRACEDLGATIVPVSLPHTAAALAAYYVLAPAEASSNLARYDGVRFGFAADRAGGGRSEALRSESSESQSQSQSQSKPSSSSPSSSRGDAFHASVASSRTAGFGSEVRRRVLVGTYVLGTELTARYHERAMRARRLVARDFARVFERAPSRSGMPTQSGGGGGGVDVLLTPTAPTCAPLLHALGAPGGDGSDGSDPSAVAGYAADVATTPASLAGLPAVSIPVGLGNRLGLPVGAQIIARRGGDVDALSFAAALEEAVWAAGSKGGGAGPWGDPAAGVLGWGPDHAALAVDDAARFGGGPGGGYH